MPEFRAVHRDELVDSQPRRVELDNRPVLLLAVDGVVHAVSGTCLHRELSLVSGHVVGHTIRCPAHLWCYDVRDGSVQGAVPGARRLPVFPVRVDEQGWVIVELPTAARAMTVHELLRAHARGEL